MKSRSLVAGRFACSLLLLPSLCQVYALEISLPWGYVSAIARSPDQAYDMDNLSAWNTSGNASIVNDSASSKVDWSLSESGANAVFDLDAELILSSVREAESFSFFEFELGKSVNYQISGRLVVEGTPGTSNDQYNYFELRRFQNGDWAPLAYEADGGASGLVNWELDGVGAGNGGVTFGSLSGTLTPGKYDLRVNSYIFNEPTGSLTGSAHFKLELSQVPVPEHGPGLPVITGLIALLFFSSKKLRNSEWRG